MSAAPGGMSEQQFTARCVRAAQYRRWRAFHALPARVGKAGAVRTAMMGDRGFPDLILARAGIVIAAELKLDAGAYGAGQREWAAELAPGIGGLVYRLWRPRDWSWIERELTTEPGTLLPSWEACVAAEPRRAPRRRPTPRAAEVPGRRWGTGPDGERVPIAPLE